MNTIDFETYDAGIDFPDNRDVKMNLDMAWWDLPTSIMHDHTPVLNQGKIGACTVFGSSWAFFETSFLDALRSGTQYGQPYDPWKVWDKAKERGASDTRGWTLQGALQLIYDMKYCVGYVKVAPAGNTNPEPLKQVLADGYCIATGTGNGDWGKIIQTGVYSEKQGFSGHVWQINGYDDNHTFPNGERGGFHSPNSWGGRGGFWIPYSMIGKLYSTYIMLDPSEVDKFNELRNFQAKLHADQAKEKGIWNGNNGTDIATDGEIRTMISRAMDIMGVRPRQYWATIFDEKILRWKWILPIWNEKDGKRNATDRELAIMFTRAVKRDPKISELSLTRFQIASVIGRDLL